MASLVWICLFLPFAAHALINPILPGFNPDPSITRVGDDYFIATSTFDVFPGHPIYHSTNLVDWELIGHGLNRASQLSLYGTPSDGGIWAPALRYHDGTFYLVSTARYVYTPEFRLFPRSFFVTTTDIFSDKWSDPIYFDALGYDSDLFWDDNGDVYNTWCGVNNLSLDKIYGIYQNKVDLATGNSLTPAELIWTGTLENNSTARPEGPHLYKVNGTYYLLIAEGGTDAGHRATIARSSSPSGPYESNPANPLLFNGADPTLSVQATGHADMIQSPDGDWWGVSLAVRPQNGSFDRKQLGRESYLFPVTWGADGWPVFNDGKPLAEHLPDVLEDTSHLHEYENTFDNPTLDKGFYFIRTPYKPFHSTSSRPGYLRLSGNSYALGDRDSVAVILRKQTSYTETFEVELEFSPTSNLTEAGITIFQNDFLHGEIGITADEGGKVILARTIIRAIQEGPYPLTFVNNTVKTVEYTPLTADGPVRLRIEGTPTTYTFSYAEANDSNFTIVATVDSSALSVPPDGTFFFKGALFGAYNTGNAFPTLSPADFSYWKQTPI